MVEHSATIRRARFSLLVTAVPCPSFGGEAPFRHARRIEHRRVLSGGGTPANDKLAPCPSRPSRPPRSRGAHGAPAVARARDRLRRRPLSGCRSSSCASSRRRPRCRATARARKRCRRASATSTITEVEPVGHYAIDRPSPTATTRASTPGTISTISASPGRALAGLSRAAGRGRPDRDARCARRARARLPRTSMTPRAPRTSRGSKPSHERETHFGYETAAEAKAGRVRGVFDSVARTTT